MSRKPVSERMCIVCQSMSPKANLVRLVLDHKGMIHLDENDNILGKGIYICKKKSCLDAFVKGRKYKRRFHNSMEEGALEVLSLRVTALDDGDAME